MPSGRGRRQSDCGRRRSRQAPGRRVGRRGQACITLFAPYGFRATYHHLTLSAAIPGGWRRTRTPWCGRWRNCTRRGCYGSRERRSTPRNAGRRSGPGGGLYQTRDRGGCGAGGMARTASGTKTRFAPSLRLSEYVRRQNAILDGAEPSGCPARGDEGPRVLSSTGHGWIELCRGCWRHVRAGSGTGSCRRSRSAGAGSGSGRT